MISNIPARGFGPGASIAFVVARGFGIGAPVVVTAIGGTWTEPARGLIWSGPNMMTLVKRLDETNTVYAYDFANDAVVAGGDPLASVTSVTVAALEIGATVPTATGATISGTKVLVTVGRGQDDAIYLFTFLAVTAGGIKRVGLGKLNINDDQ